MAKKYEEYSKEELIRLIQERDRKPKFGLVWERDEIDHDKSLNDDFVALELDPELSIGGGPHQNFVIEGDNFDALRYLRMTHAGKVKFIYIDPPYNTGNKDFIYNDRFVDKDDAYKHSKWLEYLYRRLVLAKDLMAEDGVIFVSIGEDEFAHLTLLMDQVFPGMKVGTFVWKTRSGSNISKDYFVSTDHEYVLCYANKGFTFAGQAKDFSGYTNPDKDPLGEWTNYDLTKGQTYKDRERSYYPLQNPKTGIWYPCNPDRVWAFSSESLIKDGQKLQAKSMEQVIAAGKVLWPDNDATVSYQTMDELMEAIDEGTAPRNLRRGLPDLEFWVGKTIGIGTPRYKKHKSELKRLEKPQSTWIIPNATKAKEIEELGLDEVSSITSGYTAEGTSLLRAMLGNENFTYPKPLSLILGLLRQTTSGDDMIVDFYAGSGTTAQAVLTLNAEDEQSRRFIMVSATEATNDEPTKNVCRDITRQRIGATIEGYSYTTTKGMKTVEGLGGSFAYLRTKRILSERVIPEIAHEQVWMALQLIHIDRIIPYDSASQIQTAEADENHHIAYVTEINADIVKRLKKLSTRDGHFTVYSWQPGLLAQRIMKPNISFEQIPQYLMKRFGVPS